MLYIGQSKKFLAIGVLILIGPGMISSISKASVEVGTSYPGASLVPLTNIAQVSPGGSSSCALTNQNGVKCWGRNNNGQLGDGTTETRLSAVDVSDFPSGVQVVELGRSHTCVLTVQGGVKCWGYNEYGELGDGTTEFRSSPVDVLSLQSGMKDLVGEDQSCALTTQGGIKCWGYGINGQLGYGGADEFKSTPVDVMGLQSGVQAIAMSSEHTCAITEQGGMKCWGFNVFGQLGNGKTSFQENNPVDVVSLGSSIRAIAVGNENTCALTSQNGVKCWGRNVNGELGNGTHTAISTPNDVVGLQSDVLSITLGDNHTCALVAQGGMKCWGANSWGQLGLGTTISQSLPVDVMGLASGVKDVAAGKYHTCAVTTQDEVKCWGLNQFARLGDGTTTDRKTPVSVLVEETILIPTDSPTPITTSTETPTSTLTPVPTATLIETLISTSTSTPEPTITPTAIPAEVTVQVEGKVVDAETQIGIPDVLMTLAEIDVVNVTASSLSMSGQVYTTITDLNGTYLFPAVRLGTYVLTGIKDSAVIAPPEPLVINTNQAVQLTPIVMTIAQRAIYLPIIAR